MHAPLPKSRAPRRASPGLPSLTLMSAWQRLAGVAILLALLWAAVFRVLGTGS